MDSVPSDSPRLLQPLTRREREILVLLSQELSDNEIAERLFIARTTVKWFNRQIFNKLGAESRTEAVVYGKSMGLLGADGPKPSPPSNLPAQLTPFIGRAQEIADVSRWLVQPTLRLITILAPGGMGKTRLALQVAEIEHDRYGNGVCFVPLVGLTSSDLLLSALAEALDLQFLPGGRSPRQQLFDALRHKHLLLVLDNFEQVLDGVPLVTELLSAAPQVQILVTSREKLNLTGELIYPLAGLGVPDTVTEVDLWASDAIQLFIACAQRANPHFVPRDTASIRRVCHLVQGMPLGLELAAAWSGTLSPAEIADEVAQSADFLQTTMADIPERLRSVRAVFEAAWARLSEDAQRVFRRMAVFRAGCTREAARAVTGADIITLAALVDKVLLWRNPHTERYEIHELLRQYAEQQLRAADEFERTVLNHQHYYARIAETWTAAMLGDRQLEGLAALDADARNVRQALTQATAQSTPEAIEPFTNLWIYFDMRSHWQEADDSLRIAGDALESRDSLALAKLLTGRSILYDRIGTMGQAYETGKRGYEMTARLGVRQALPLAIIAYADSLRSLGHWDESRALYQTGLEIAEDVHEPLMSMILSYHLAVDADWHGRTEEGREKVRDVYLKAAQLDNLWVMCFSLNYLAAIAIYSSDLDEAERLYNEYLKMAHTIGFHYMESEALMGLSEVASRRQDWPTVYQRSQDALKQHYETGRLDGQAFAVLLWVAESAIMLNKLDEAVLRLREAFSLRNQEMLEGYFLAFETLVGKYLIRSGNYRLAVTFFTHAQHLLKDLNLHPADAKLRSDALLNGLQVCRTELAPDAYAAAVNHGRSLTRDAVLTELSHIF